MSARQARSWVRLRRTEFTVRVVLVLAWCAALAGAVAPPDAACTPADPLACTTDATGGVAVALALVCPVLLAMAPLTGCAAAVVFGVLDLAFDSDPSAHVGFGAHAGLAVVSAVAVIAVRAAQGRIVRAADALPVTMPALPPQAVRNVRRGRAVAVGVLTIAGVALAFGYGRAAAGVAEHEHTAKRMNAIVTNHEAEGSLLRLDVAPGLGVPVHDLSAYPVGSELPVLVSGSGDELWVRPVAEPEDVSWWLTLAAAALLLAGFMEASRRWARRRLSALLAAGRAGPVLLCVPTGKGGAVLGAAGVALVTVPVVKVPVPEVPPTGAPPRRDDVVDDDMPVWGRAVDPADVVDRVQRGGDGEKPATAHWRPVTVVGDLHVGGWVLLVLDDGLLLPGGPLSSQGVDSDLILPEDPFPAVE